jgi:hypothetical protein
MKVKVQNKVKAQWFVLIRTSVVPMVVKPVTTNVVKGRLLHRRRYMFVVQKLMPADELMP